MAKKDKTKIEPDSEASLHPVAQEEGKNVEIRARDLTDFVDKIHSRSEEDITATTTHRQKLAHWYDRRFGTLNKAPQFPWVGSSNITMPLIDMEVTKDKAPLLQTLEIDPIVSFKAQSARAFDQTDAAEHTMQWLLTSRMRDFKKNMEIVVDNRGTYGYGVAKTVYEYSTKITTETIRREELTQEDLEGVAGLLLAVEQGVNINEDPEGEEIIPTQDDLDLALTALIVERFGLNPEDVVDQKAIQDVMDFILKEEDNVSIKRNFITHDAPYLTWVDPSRIFIEEGALGFEDAERVTEIFFDTVNDMKSKAKTGYYDSKIVDEILQQFRNAEDGNGDDGISEDSKANFSQLDVRKREREGVNSTARSSSIENREVYCMYDIDGDGVEEKCLLIYNAMTKKVLRFMEFPYEHGEWPYTQIRYEETDGRFLSSRSIGEVINDIDDMITQNHRNKLNAMQIGNSPTFKYRLGSNINPANIKWIPGQFIPVMNMTDFEQVNVNVKDFSFDNEEGQLRFWNEGLLGSFDAAFRDQKSESRTAREVSAIQGVQQSAQSLKVARFQRDMKKIYSQIWSLWMQYGPPEFTVATSDGQLRQLSKYELDADLDLTPVGTIGNINPEVEFQRAQGRLQTIMQLIGTVGIEGLQQMAGVKYELDLGVLLKDVFNKDDFISGNRIMRKRTPEEVREIEAQQLAAQQAAQAEQQRQQDIEGNRPIPLEELQAGLKQMERQAPNGGAQRLS